jgi:hypothetical protein
VTSVTARKKGTGGASPEKILAAVANDQRESQPRIKARASARRKGKSGQVSLLTKPTDRL